MSIAVVTEKPAVARDIAKVLNAHKRGEGYLHGAGYVLTWAYGHLITLAQPHEINPDWKRWSRAHLPMLPDQWPLIINEKTHDQFQIISRILNSNKVQQVVCATDAGREGELIFRYIYEAAGCQKPVSRLWISSLTSAAIKQGFQQLRDGSEFDPLAAAARGRSQADWLVGMNLSRACSLTFRQAYGEVLSVGRVQTPTLAMVVERELAIRDFVPQDYLEVVVSFAPQEVEGQTASEDSSYQGTWFRGVKPESKAKRLEPDGEEAEAIVERARSGQTAVESNTAETRRQPPPLLYDLTELQRHANRLYGFSADKTLKLAQQLYEQRKLISYPRTDSRYLSQDVALTLGPIVQAIQQPYQALLAPNTAQVPLSKRFVNDAKVSDHHAIIPTPHTATGLSADEHKIYDLICRRLLATWHENYIWLVTTVISTVTSEKAVVDRYHSSGTVVKQLGWRILDPVKTQTPEDRLPLGLDVGRELTVLDVEILKKQTRPPPRFTEATLLTGMESAGKSLDDKALSEAMKETGLGTPATRAETIETLLRRQYLQRKGKSLEATERGVRLIQLVHPQLKSPAMTGRWEAQLKRIQRGEESLEDFMTGISAYVQDAVAKTLATDCPASSQDRSQLAVQEDESSYQTEEQRTPTPPERLAELLQSDFGLERFRPYQEAVCQAVVQGQDVLLVMPTGAGKSLCYQLPGLARAGTTLVISPLIALMEDQVSKLQQQSLRAERIHSGRDRASSRQVCVDYLAGRLDYLFIAPERLSVHGFPEMLAKRKPVLIAVDEAHCISHWGHDFRPDYRLLGQRLPLLRPAPVIAMTATATPLVQDDIVQQLGMPESRRFIHGFRRTNIAVEMVEMKPSERASVVHRVLADAQHRPAIVYAPTRKEANSLGASLSTELPAASYHAGMLAADREQVQNRFLNGELEVIVATIAFGMGVDKPDIRTVIHTGLPSTVEGYYQEIGRAGRDGLPSRAILLYSYADRRTHEFFQNRDYPPIEILERIQQALDDQWRSKESLEQKLNINLDDLERALDKLWIHGGVQINPEEYVCRAGADWQPAYQAQCEHKQAQLEQITRSTQAHICRMLTLVRHFGDQEDSGESCGLCDVCAPDDCWVRQFRQPTRQEQGLIRQVLEELRRWDGQSTGKLYRELGVDLERRTFEAILGGLSRSDLIRVNEDAFQKGGRTIRFQRAFLTDQGRNSKKDVAVLLTEQPVASKSSRRKTSKSSKVSKVAQVDLDEAPPHLVDALKSWRLTEARKRQIPAFRILSDRVLKTLAVLRPKDEAGLLSVPGIGPTLVNKYSKQLLGILGRTKS